MGQNIPKLLHPIMGNSVCSVHTRLDTQKNHSAFNVCSRQIQLNFIFDADTAFNSMREKNHSSLRVKLVVEQVLCWYWKRCCKSKVCFVSEKISITLLITISMDLSCKRLYLIVVCGYRMELLLLG